MSLEADALADRRRLRRKLSFWRVIAFLIALVAIATGFGVLGGGASLIPKKHIARVDISGIIVDNRAERKMLREIGDNKNVRALILAIDSPGGTTTGAEALFGTIREVAEKKPVVATLGTVAASGGYIAAIAADHIVARGNTLAGSIGVVVQWPNATELLDRVGVRVRSVKSSAIKAEPTPFTEAPPEAIAVLEDVVTDSYNWFINLVVDRRNLNASERVRVGDARVFTGRDALEAKLVDAIGGEKAAREWLASEHGIETTLEIKTYKPDDSLRRFAGADGLIGRFLSYIGLAPLAGLGGSTGVLDGVVSVWHPE